MKTVRWIARALLDVRMAGKARMSVQTYGLHTLTKIAISGTNSFQERSVVFLHAEEKVDLFTRPGLIFEELRCFVWWSTSTHAQIVHTVIRHSPSSPGWSSHPPKLSSLRRHS